MDDETIDKIFAGRLENLPAVSSKIVRIFTSSTFTDTGMERNTLMAEVYPKIKEYCREKHGLEFQVVDMRWGIRDEATDDHMTTELCMREIINCQRLSMGPNFVVFLGQKYGYRPIPTIIVATELITLKETLKKMSVDTHLLDLWYRKDTNAVPHIFILQPISTILIHFCNKEAPKLQARDQGIWWDTLGKMQKLLRKAAHRCLVDKTMPEDAVHSYFMSVTEREVINGLLNVDNTKGACLGYIRMIQNINLQNVKKACNYIDFIGRTLDTEAAMLLSNLRDVRLVNKLEASNLQKYTVEWMGREGLALATHEEYLNHFLLHFYKNITKLVDRAMKKEDTSAFGAIITEQLQHLNACNYSVSSFHGREESLTIAKKYILGDLTTPFILYGAGGCGKTSLLAKIATMSFPWHAERGAVPLLLIRFLGTTPDSSTVTPMLTSICQQISFNFNLAMEDIPDDLVPLTAYFKEMIMRGTAERPFLLCLDSIDQLTGASGANKLTWLPSKLPKHCKIVLSSVYEPSDEVISQDYLLLRRIMDSEECFLEVPPLGEDLACKVIRRWLETANRDVSHYQWRVVCNALVECSLPVFVKLVFAEICRWKSYSKPQDTQLAVTVMDSIFNLFSRVEKQHGPILVAHALSYVTAARSGLSETELEDLISLDDKVLDDVYQYHMPPTRRVPPLLWTRIRNDLPNYLSDGEAGGVRVMTWYHRQFRDAARTRYFQDPTMVIYFHSSIADYFLGIWGGGAAKPFKYTEMQRFRFNLKSRDGFADRKVPLQPLVYTSKEGKVARYNLRKFGELPFHLIRSERYQDLYSYVLFNYQWLYAKIAAAPIQSTLSDYEDACLYVSNKEESRQMLLVADALRLGGAVLLNHSQMLGPQLVGRLLPEIKGNSHIQSLLKQCDIEGICHNALIPSHHCMHTPGGPLKYSLEGHPFAVFGICLTADFRYIISISNKFLTWDLSTSDLTREVSPKIEGVLQGLVIGPDNRYGAAFTNNSKIVLLNMLTNEFEIMDNPLVDGEVITGLFLINAHLIVYGARCWVVINMRGEIETVTPQPEHLNPILKITLTTLEDYFMILWSGSLDDTKAQLITRVEGVKLETLDFQGALVFCSSRTKLYTCMETHGNAIVEMNLVGEQWETVRVYDTNQEELHQLELSQEETYIVGTFLTGFKIINLESGEMTTLLLPQGGIRNISNKMLESNSCVLSKDAVYGIAGVRKNLYVWDLKTGKFLKELDAHFGRIIKILSLNVGNWNSVITSSIDRTVKIWNVNNIFEQVHSIDRHEMQIDSISISSGANFVASVTRSCIGLWDLQTGKLDAKLADSPLGAIVTHAVITKNGRYIISSESGFVIIWDLRDLVVLFKEEQKFVKQMYYLDKDQVFVTVSKISGQELKIDLANCSSKCHAVGRKMPNGEKLYELNIPIKTFKELIPTSDETYLVGAGIEKKKDTLFIFDAKTGNLCHKILLKYPKFKDFSEIVIVPNRATQVALIDTDKGNIIDVRTRKFIRSIRLWGGKCTKDGKFGLYASGRGGLELVDLKSGKIIRTFIPKVAEGVFTVITMFNRTDEFVLYYHGGRKTVRVFRTSDGVLIANYRVQAELSAIDTTEDGKSIVLGTLDGCVTILTIADPAKPGIQEYLLNLPSRDENAVTKKTKIRQPMHFRSAANMVKMAVTATSSPNSPVSISPPANIPTENTNAEELQSALAARLDSAVSQDESSESSRIFSESTQQNSEAFTLPERDTEDESDAETLVDEEDGGMDAE